MALQTPVITIDSVVERNSQLTYTFRCVVTDTDQNYSGLNITASRKVHIDDDVNVIAPSVKTEFNDAIEKYVSEVAAYTRPDAVTALAEISAGVSTEPK